MKPSQKKRVQQCKEIIKKFIELKQNQKHYKHKNLVNGRSPMQFKHVVAHIYNAKLKVQNQTVTKTHQNEKSFWLCDSENN
jgi:hypothetical protein